ncbi:MAG TPA: hypothetical protein VFD39_03975 [Trueperaceae bacterium]|nr:hypothetical protein [Trueperaceae bacterium]
MTLLVIGVISFAMSLVATLELLSARSAANAVGAGAAAQGALALALAEVSSAAAGGTLSAPGPDAPGSVYGPWPQHGVPATAGLHLLASGQGPDGGATSGGSAVYRLSVKATVGKAHSTASLVFTLEPELTVLERRQ